MASSDGFSQLPDEMILKIFTYLDIPDLALNVQHVNSHWKDIVQDRIFWKDYVFHPGEKMTDKEIIQLIKNMPELRALAPKRGITNKLIPTVCTNCRFLTCIELHRDHKLTISNLEKLVKHLPHIQRLAFTLPWSQSTQEYLQLIQQFHQLKSLTLLGEAFEPEHLFLSAIADECPLLQEIDIGDNNFLFQDIKLFLQKKNKLLSKFSIKSSITAGIVRLLGSCKLLECLYIPGCDELPNIPFLELPKLKELGLTDFQEGNFSLILRHFSVGTMSKIVKLTLFQCCLTAAQFDIILTHCVQVKSLVLKYSFVPSGDDFHLIEKCSQLEYLEVFGCNITDLAIEKFSAKCKKLKYLDLSSCTSFTEYALGYLMKCNTLNILKLDETNITGENFQYIPIYLTHLQELHIQECRELNLKYVKCLQEEMCHLKVLKNNYGATEDFIDLTETNMFSEYYN